MVVNSLLAQAVDAITPESFDLMVSTNKDSSNLNAYTITIQNITVNSSGNIYPGTGAYLAGALGEWNLYEFALDSIANLNVGDSIFIGFHYHPSNGYMLLIDELQYDFYCTANNSWGISTVNYDLFGTGYYTTNMWFNIFTVSLNEIFRTNDQWNDRNY